MFAFSSPLFGSFNTKNLSLLTDYNFLLKYINIKLSRTHAKTKTNHVILILREFTIEEA